MVQTCTKVGQIHVGIFVGDTELSRWSFGGNKLQLKAEVRLLSDVLTALRSVAGIGNRPTRSLQTLGPKQELLVHLLESECQRLNVWLSPLDREGGGFLSGHWGNRPATDVRDFSNDRCIRRLTLIERNSATYACCMGREC